MLFLSADGVLLFFKVQSKLSDPTPYPLNMGKNRESDSSVLLCHHLPKDDFFFPFSVEPKSQVQCMDLGGFV